MNGIGLALTYARRELRGGLKGFRLFLACLALGVAAIAGVGSVATAVDEGLRADASVLLGGDVDIRLMHRQIDDRQRAYLQTAGDLSETIELRTMPRAPGTGHRHLVELKSVDDAYPLYGKVELDPPLALDEALARRDGVAGAVADAVVFETLGVGVGDTITVGDTSVELRARIVREPDRATRVFVFGPRLMIAQDTLAETGLVQPGSLVSYHYRLKLPAGTDIPPWTERLGEIFPDAGWRIRDTRNASPGLKSFVDRLAVYLTLVGLTALLVGGVGVAGAVRNFLDGKIGTIAILKCLGASNAAIFRIYLTQILILAVGGTLLGLMIGALAPAAAAPLIDRYLPIAARIGIYPAALLTASAYGLLTALVFSLWPLAGVREVAPGQLFRSALTPIRNRPPRAFLGAIGILAAILAGLAIWGSHDRWLAGWFVAGAIVTLLTFRGAAALIGAAARRALKTAPLIRGRPGLRLAIANLDRPGAPTTSVVLSLGLGLTVLIAVALVQGNLSRQVTEDIPAVAPTFFFIDIQPDQIDSFEDVVESIPGAGAIERVPIVRGRIIELDGVPVEQVKIAPHAQWAVRSDRGLTYAETVPEGSSVVAGQWWPAGYNGPPLLSFDEELAAGMGIEVGDTMTINVLGREVTATVANLRRIDWTTLGINFAIVFAPGALEGAPQSHVATVVVPAEQETALLRAVTDKLPNVSGIRVKDALDAVNKILNSIADATRITAGVALLAGALVLAGAVTAGHRRRVYDAVVLKVLGARRRQILRAFLIEYGLLGVAAAALAACLGTAIAWAVLTQVMGASWTFLPSTVVITASLCVIAALAFGFAGTWRALVRKAAPLLRNE